MIDQNMTISKSINEVYARKEDITQGRYMFLCFVVVSALRKGQLADLGEVQLNLMQQSAQCFKHVYVLNQ